MRQSTFKSRRNLLVFTVLMMFVSQLECGTQIAFADDVAMEETTSKKDPKLTWKLLQRALERVQHGRLDEADGWLWYAMLNASADPLLEAREDREFLATGLNITTSNNAPLSGQDCDIRILQALIQARIGSLRSAIESLRFVEKSCPMYHYMNQVKLRITALNLAINPPRQQSYYPEPRALSQKEFQEILERIAREKVAVSESKKTLDQALAEAKEEQLEKYARWRANRFPLKVFVPTDVSCAKIPGYAAGDRSFLIASFQIWQKTMKDRIKFVFVEMADKADITCEWVDHPDMLGSKSKDAIGTCIRHFGSFFIGHAEIRILTLGGKNAAPTTVAFRGKYLRSVALHEIGHALGVEHLPNQKSIMYFQLSYPLLETLAADDIGAMDQIVLSTQREAERTATIAGVKPKVDAASARIKRDEDTIRYLVTNVESQLKGAKDLERLHAWDHAFSFYEDALKYRPSDPSIRQSICRTANNAARAALNKGRQTEAIKYLRRGRELMNKETPIELRQQILETLRQSYEMNNQQTEASEVQTVLQSGNF